MADVLAIMDELGANAELLLAPDAWLESRRVCLQQGLSLAAEELAEILAAQRIKNMLQQRNMVAVRCVDKAGPHPDVVIEICPITDALDRLDRERRDPSIPQDVSEMNERQQVDTWEKDGYDVDASRKVRARKRRHG